MEATERQLQVIEPQKRQAEAALVSVVPAKGLRVDGNFKESQLADVLPGRVFPKLR